jgi:glycosyltransferase involved in cell wall biosynthesis
VRLVIDGQRLTAGRTGVGRCLESLLADWSETGWPLDDVRLIIRDRGGLANVPRSRPLTTTLVGENWPGLVWETLGLGRLLRPDDVLLAPANLVPWTWQGRTVLIIYDTLPWSLPGSFPRHVRWRFGWRYRLAARRASRVIVPSHATARDVAQVHGLSLDRLRVAYPGPEPWFRPLPTDASEVVEARRTAGLGSAPYFLFVGKRSRRRNVPAVLDAFARHRERFPDHRLVFVGPDRGVPVPEPGSGVLKPGHVDEQVLHGLLAGALGLLYPSEYEGFGLPVVEAQASGCPVVTLRNSALTESGGAAAHYLDAATPELIARSMELLATDEGFRNELVVRGLDHVRHFSRSEFARVVKEEIRLEAGRDQLASKPRFGYHRKSRVL